jgi:hypothetical protein
MCNPQPNSYYAVEVTTDYNLFAGNGTANTFYGSYEDESLLSAPTYRLTHSKNP